MDTQQELQVQQKREVEKKPESTIPARVFLPVADIFETDQSLTVILEMPGANKDSVEISAELKDGVMTLVLPKSEKAKPRKISVSGKL